MRVEVPGGELVDVPLSAVADEPSWYGLVCVVDEPSAKRLGVPGVVFGHSGAPVFVDGELVGAMGQALSFDDNELAFGARTARNLRWWRDLALRRYLPAADESASVDAQLSGGCLVSYATVYGDYCNGPVGTVTEVADGVVMMSAHGTRGREGAWNRAILEVDAVAFQRRFFTPHASQLSVDGDRGAVVGHAFFNGPYGLVGIAGADPPSFEVRVAPVADPADELEYHIVINPVLNDERTQVARHVRDSFELGRAPTVIEVRRRGAGDGGVEPPARFGDIVDALGHVFDRAEAGSRWDVVVREEDAAAAVASPQPSTPDDLRPQLPPPTDPALDPPVTATVLLTSPGQDSLPDRSHADGEAKRWTLEPGPRRGDLVGRWVAQGDGGSALVFARLESPHGTEPFYAGVPRAEVAGFLSRRFGDLPGLRVGSERLGDDRVHVAGCWGERARLSSAVVVAEWDRGRVVLVDEFSRWRTDDFVGFSVLPAPAVDPQRLVGVTGSVTAVCDAGEPIGRVVRDDGVFVVYERIDPSLDADEPQRIDVTIRVDVEDETYRTRVLHGAEWNQAFTQALRSELLRQISLSIPQVDGSEVQVAIACGEAEWNWAEDHVVQDFNFYGNLATRCVRLLAELAPASARVEIRQIL